jgi:hypothetical protein
MAELARNMTSSKYTCPLCDQPVSSSVYMKITGIWKAKEKELAKVKTERANLKKMQKQFKIQKVKIIKSAVEKNTRQYETKMKILKAREKKIEIDANKRVARAFKEAHTTEQLKFKSRELQIKKKLENSMKKEARVVRQRVMSDAKVKYTRIERSLKSNISQLKNENQKSKKQNDTLSEHVARLEKQLKEKATPQVEGLLYEKVDETTAKAFQRR